MYIKKAEWPCLIKGLRFLSVCLQGGWTAANWLYGPNLQDIDYLRQQIINYSKLPLVTPCVFRCSFLYALSVLCLFSFFLLSHSQSFIYSFSLLVLCSPLNLYSCCTHSSNVKSIVCCDHILKKTSVSFLWTYFRYFFYSQSFGICWTSPPRLLNKYIFN